jgi:hypothetical protein
MKNGDKPAHPTGHSQSGTGLTKREMFAMAAMQGLLSACNGTGHGSQDMSHIAEMSVQFSDELLKQLES